MDANEEPIRSPCISNCCLDERDVCLGCFRLLPEIIGWTDANNNERQRILAAAASRKEAHHRQYLGFKP